MCTKQKIKDRIFGAPVVGAYIHTAKKKNEKRSEWSAVVTKGVQQSDL